MYEHRYRENKLHGQPEFPLHIYRVEHQACVHSILPVHWHNEMEIIYLAEGRATFQVESREFTIQAGDALIVHPGNFIRAWTPSQAAPVITPSCSNAPGSLHRIRTGCSRCS